MLRYEERAEGCEEGCLEERNRIAVNMLKENLPLSLIARVTTLTEAEILTIADSLGISPA